MTRRLTLAVAGLLLLAACGGQAADTTAQGGGDSTPKPTVTPGQQPTDATAPSALSEMPDVTVVNVATEEQVALASLIPAPRPILLWFWAPH